MRWIGTQTRRTANSRWHPEDRLDLNTEDAALRGIRNGDWVTVTSR